jgi:hypothetical protein
MGDSERARILAEASQIKSISRGAVVTYVAGHSGNSLESLRRALNVERGPVGKLRDAIIERIFAL